MTKTRRQIVDMFCNKIESGEIEYSDVRRLLERDRHSEEDINIILERIDRDLDRMATKKSEKSKGKQMVFLGLSIMTLGILVTIGTYNGIIDIGNRYIIAYGPTLGGLGLAMVGAVKMNQ